MAQNHHLDIFAADLDVKEFIPSPDQARAGQSKQWTNVQLPLVGKKKQKAKKQPKQKQKPKTIITWNKVPPAKSNNRLNLTVIENISKTSSDSNKPAPATSTSSATQHMEEKADCRSEGVESKQSLGVSGRMTASSFMKVNQPATSSVVAGKRPFPNQKQTIQMQIGNYPKGIPRSFLTAAHQQQIELRPAAPPPAPPPATPATPAAEPVWEALPPKGSQPVWSSTKSRFDQLPSGQYAQAAAPAPPAPPAAEAAHEPRQQYSPSDSYADMPPEGHDELCRSPDSQAGCKRVSAFQRLGPVAPAPPKKHKLTINLSLQDEHVVREVVQGAPAAADKYLPAPARAEVVGSADDTVRRYLPLWPWTRPPHARRTLTHRGSKAAMQLDLEQMEPEYEKDKNFFEISVTGYPAAWSKEDVLDAVLEAVHGNSLIPCFIEFGPSVCRFLVIRSRAALVALHELGFKYRKEEVVLTLAIKTVSLSVNQLDFIPRLVLRRRLAAAMQGDTRLDLRSFTLQPDISHFVYFPLSRARNQSELMQLQSSVPWQLLTHLDLSHNRMESLGALELARLVPRLRVLDVSYNRLRALRDVQCARGLALHAVRLEGNPLCLDFIHRERYVAALRLMFPALQEIDGVQLAAPGALPAPARNYCPAGGAGAEGGAAVAGMLLHTLFPLLDAPDQRHLLEHLYTDDAVLTLTFMYKLRYEPIYKEHFPLFARARALEEGLALSTRGAVHVARLVQRWPPLQHDPATFTVDVFYHTEACTMLRVSGVLKVAACSLAQEEHVLHFTRTLVLRAEHDQYRVAHEMLHWDLPAAELARAAFRMTTGRRRDLSLKLDGPPDAELRKQLTEIFMQITELDQERSEKCLESKEWHLKNALEYFTRLLKLDTLDVL